MGGGLAIARAGGLAGLHREQGWEAGKGGGAEDYADKVGFLSGGKSVRSRSSHTSSRSVSQFPFSPSTLFSFRLRFSLLTLLLSLQLSYPIPFHSLPFLSFRLSLAIVDGRSSWRDVGLRDGAAGPANSG